MGKFWCGYCGSTIIGKSASVRTGHLTGKKHQIAVQQYWETIAEMDKEQSQHFEKTLIIPGLTEHVISPEVEAHLDKFELPKPVFL